MHLRPILPFLLAILPLPAQGPLIVRGPYLQLGTPTSVVVRWRTDLPTDSRLWVGPAPGALSPSTQDPVLTTEHELVLSNLQPETVYYYAVGTTGGIMAGNDAAHFFRTAPPPGSRRPMRTWVLGDSGTASAWARSVRDGYYEFTGSRHTDLWLMLGDNAYNTGTDLEYQGAVFDNMYEAMLQKSVLWPALGNHDAISVSAATQSGPFFDIFTLPTNGEAGGVPSGVEDYYSFDWGNVHYVCLNSAEISVAATPGMLAWLQADVTATTADWVIVFFHHPPYTKGTHDSDTDWFPQVVRTFFVPVLEALGVDLVMCGHSHGYERSMLLDGHTGFSTTFNPATMAVDQGDGRLDGTGAYRKATTGPGPHEGTVYLVGGSSGQTQPAPLNHPVMVSNHEHLGSCVLDVNGLQLDVRFVAAEGAVFDHFTIVKGGVTPVQYAHTPLPSLDPWGYEDSGLDLGTAWRAPSYNDASWSTGNAILGYGEPFISTTLSFGGDPLNVNRTAYFRKTFTLAHHPAFIDALRLDVLFDDGYAAYLNGQEVARKSLPTGPIAYGTFASLHEAAFYETVDLSAHRALLNQGLNTLAVEVHQASQVSSDLVFDARLTYDAFIPHLSPCAAGWLNEDVLLVGGTAGGSGRSVDVPTNQPLTIEVLQPQAQPGNADFVLFGTLGTPTTANTVPLAPTMGALCFLPAWVAPQDPALFTLASSLLPPAPALLQVPPAPWSLTLPAGSLLPGLQLTLQPLLLLTPTDLKVANAVRVAILP